MCVGPGYPYSDASVFRRRAEASEDRIVDWANVGPDRPLEKGIEGIETPVRRPWIPVQRCERL